MKSNSERKRNARNLAHDTLKKSSSKTERREMFFDDKLNWNESDKSYQFQIKTWCNEHLCSKYKWECVKMIKNCLKLILFVSQVFYHLLSSKANQYVKTAEVLFFSFLDHVEFNNVAILKLKWGSWCGFLLWRKYTWMHWHKNVNFLPELFQFSIEQSIFSPVVIFLTFSHMALLHNRLHIILIFCIGRFHLWHCQSNFKIRK